MTAVFHLVRHAAHERQGEILAGRAPGVVLGERGRAQALRLAHRLRRERFDAVHASPRERTRETAAAIVELCGGGPVEIVPALDEIDFGAWSGMTWEELDPDPAWRRWNTARGVARTPGGESVLDLQRRVLGHLESLLDRGEGRYVLVSHADVIKSVVSWHLGLPVESWARFEIAPASITTLVVGDWGGKVIGLNEAVP